MFSSARARVVLIILILCFSASAWLGIYTNPHGQTRFVKYFAALAGNATATVGGRPIPSFGNATKPTDLDLLQRAIDLRMEGPLCLRLLE